MLNIVIPKEHYNTVDYPILDPQYDGAFIPIAIGDIHNIIPACINTVTQRYSICGHAIHDITAVRTETETLIPALDYTEYVADGEFEIAISTTPLLVPGTYWFVIEADYVADASNHIRFSRWNNNGQPPSYSIDGIGAGTWTADATHHLECAIFGRDTIVPDSKETRRIRLWRETTWSQLALRDDPTVTLLRTRIAQRFVVASNFYLTKIRLEYQRVGHPVGNIIIRVLDAAGPPVGAGENQVGAQSIALTVGTSGWMWPKVQWSLRSVDLSAIYCDIEGAESIASPGNPIVSGADAIQYLVETVLGKDPLLLDAGYLADFRTDRTQEIKIYIDSDKKFGEVIGKLESSLLFKLIPLLNGTYGTVVYESGEDSNTPHFTDDDYLSFSLHHDWAAVKHKVIIKYDEDAQGQAGYKIEEVLSDFARFFYASEETLEVETYHRTQPGAAWLAGALSGMYETPPIIAEFEVHGWGLDLIPGRDKVSLTRGRAGYAGGTLNDELFRIIKLVKKPGTSTVVITAQLDTQTY